MKRKNRQRGKRAHQTALLNKALKALKEKNDLPTCESLEKFTIKKEKLDFCLKSSEEEKFEQFQPYQDAFNHFASKHQVWPSKSDDSDLLSPSSDSMQEKYMVSQIKIENGCHIKCEETDESIQEGYDGELNSDGELNDPLSYMTIKLEPTDELPSPGNSLSCNSVDVVPNSPSIVNENTKVGELLNANKSPLQIKDVNHNNDFVINGVKIETVAEVSSINALTKQQLKNIDSEVSSSVSETNSETSNNFPNLNSVYHIIKDTDSSLTCKFVKSEILKEEIDKSSLKSEEIKSLEQKASCVKSEVFDNVYDYESDSTLPIDDDDDDQQLNENTENKDKDIAGKKACEKPLYHHGTSLLLEGLGNSNSSSVLSTVEGDFTPYEDFTFAQVNEEALMKRLVFRDSSEEETFPSESNICNKELKEEGISTSELDVKKKLNKKEISAPELEAELVAIKKELSEEKISALELKIESVVKIKKEPKEKEISVLEQETIKRKQSEVEYCDIESEIKPKPLNFIDLTTLPNDIYSSDSIKKKQNEVEISDVESEVKAKFCNFIDLTVSPNAKADILTKKISIKVERIDCTEKNVSHIKSLKNTLCPEVENISIKKEPSHILPSKNKVKKSKKRKSLEKPESEIIEPKKSKNEIIELKKPKSEIIDPKKPKHEIIEPKKPKHEIIEPKKPKLEIIEPKKPKLKIVEFEKQKSVEDEQLSVPLYVRPKRRKISFQEKLDEPQKSVWDSELLPHPSLLSTVGIGKIKQLKIQKKKKSKDSTHKELAAGMASAKQRLAKNLCLLSAPIQKFTVERTRVKNDLIESEKDKSELANENSVNELEQIIDALSTKEEMKNSSSLSLGKRKADVMEEVEIELAAKIEDNCELSKSISVPIINDALLQEILTTGFINCNGDTQIYIEPIKPKYRVVTAPPPFPKPSVPFNLDYLVARIGSWNVAWLEEQTLNLEPPPDITYYARNPILSYVCYDEYFDVYYPFLMLEIWQFMFESWQRRIYNSENIIFASVISHEIEDDVLILQCKVTLDNHTTILNFPFEGHLVILNLNVHGCENQAQVFGYVTDHRVEQSSDTDCNEEKLCNESVAVYLTIKTKVRLGDPDFEKVIMIEHLCLFKLYVLEFEALVNLSKNELVCNILRPQEISYLSKQEKPFLSLGSYSAEQQNAILDLSQLTSSLEPNVSFVSGAPGSGKTHTLVGLVQQLLCEDGHNHNIKLLVVTQTHSGINDIGCRLVKLQHLFKRSNKRELRLVRVGSFECTHPGLQAHCIDNLVTYNLERNKEELHNTEIRFLAIENDIAKLKNLLINCKPHSDEICSAQRKVDKLILERRQLQKKLGYLKTKMSIDEEERKVSMRLEILENADVILTTIHECRSSALVSAYSGDNSCRFKCCIVDDATQLTELELLTLLLYDTQKLVLFGDTQQLIPKVKSIASREYGYQLSYFERCQLYFQNLSDVPPCNFCVLREQFRMHSDICDFSSSYFYGDKVITPLNIDKYRCFPKLHSCVIFDITDGVQSMDMLNICNLPEAQFVIKIISELSKFIKCRWNIGIIASCWGQCDILQKLLTNDIKVKHDVEIGTVDYFQGHEKDVIILSCVQTKHREGENFLSCQHLFNLAITRAQKLLIVCGSAGFLQEWTHWKMFIKYIDRKKMFFRTKSTCTNIMLHLTNSRHN